MQLVSNSASGLEERLKEVVAGLRLRNPFFFSFSDSPGICFRSEPASQQASMQPASKGTHAGREGETMGDTTSGRR